MEICNKCEIVFNEYTCPLCAANKEISVLEKEIEKLEDELLDR